MLAKLRLTLVLDFIVMQDTRLLRWYVQLNWNSRNIWLIVKGRMPSTPAVIPCKNIWIKSELTLLGGSTRSSTRPSTNRWVAPDWVLQNQSKTGGCEENVFNKRQLFVAYLALVVLLLPSFFYFAFFIRPSTRHDIVTYFNATNNQFIIQLW